MDKIYLAGSCGSESRTIMKDIANQLREMGVEVYCPFELKIPDAWDMCQEEWARKVFDKDIAAIRDCDVFVMITPGRALGCSSVWLERLIWDQEARRFKSCHSNRCSQ